MDGACLHVLLVASENPRPVKMVSPEQALVRVGSMIARAVEAGEDVWARLTSRSGRNRRGSLGKSLATSRVVAVAIRGVRIPTDGTSNSGLVASLG